MLCLSTSSGERGPAGAAGELQAGPYGQRRCRDVHDEPDGTPRYVSPFFHDGTERPIQRPKDPEEQQEHYSGKNKGHTLKNLLVIDEPCHMGFLSATYKGKMHDKTMAKLVR